MDKKKTYKTPVTQVIRMAQHQVICSSPGMENYKILPVKDW